MAWVDIKEVLYDSYASYGTVYAKLQYDDARSTPNTLVVRFTGKCTSRTTDGYCVLWKPGDSSGERLYQIKTRNSATTTQSGSEFTITKDYSANSFPIATWWLCHTGQTSTSDGTLDLTNRKIKFADWQTSDGKAKSFYQCFNYDGWHKDHPRGSYKEVIAASSFTATIDNGLDATGVGKGSCTVTDNYNNTFTITVTPGAAGSNNPVTSKSIWWTQTRNSANTDWSYSTANNSETFTGSSYSKTFALSITNSANATKTVAGAVTTVGTYTYTDAEGKKVKNYSDSGWKTANIKQYVAPSNPTSVTLSWTKRKPTNKENLTYSWSGAAKANNSSPITGYCIALYKNGVNVQIKNNSGTNLCTQNANGTWIWRSDRTSMTIYPNQYNLKKGDTLQLKVKAYTQYGASNTGSYLEASGTTDSEVTTIQSSNTIYIKTGTSTWEEAEGLYIKTGPDTWEEADGLYIKTNTTTWEETE